MTGSARDHRDKSDKPSGARHAYGLPVFSRDSQFFTFATMQSSRSHATTLMTCLAVLASARAGRPTRKWNTIFLSFVFSHPIWVSHFPQSFATFPRHSCSACLQKFRSRKSAFLSICSAPSLGGIGCFFVVASCEKSSWGF